MKIILIHIADMFDHYILRHKVIFICDKIGQSDWWGEHFHNCWYCRKFGSDSDWIGDK